MASCIRAVPANAKSAVAFMLSTIATAPALSPTNTDAGIDTTAASVSVIVTSTLLSSSVALRASTPLRATVNCCSCSTTVSFSSATVIVCSVSPAAKATVPLVAVKSVPAVAVPLCVA